ncbi:LacI family DNA-binding transcriptional regulator [Paenibacillus sp.]|uniref:LacI family DNA-binding transcriptional regulator n=1 Tax=Paenibacillus sp. TaxID=58172 RepID=UPI002D681DF5|nr:LacI family DNA-binding transcriptional regulator [Paenibacillus sp.]HZG85837.1 LacI family DNA-binding transcriptional regulator [Paenibacillus sp.]
MVGMKDVARRANVSTATVSHVLNGTRYVSRETAMKVYDAMRELNYRPNSVARSLRSKKSRTIGLLVPMTPQGVSNSYFMSVAQGIEKVLKANGYNLILSNSNDDALTEMEQIRVFDSQLIDGLIIAPSSQELPYLREAMTGDYPLVFIDRKPRAFAGDSIVTDGGGGTYRAVTHLIRSGHRRIGFISASLSLATSEERLQGYRRALAEHGIEPDDALVQAAKEHGSSFEHGYRLACRLHRDHRATALFVANNVMTMGALKYLQEHRVTVPEEVALVGFDDYEWALITKPPLSMVRQPSQSVGEVAAQVLLDRIRDPSTSMQEIRLPTEFILRSSC